MDGEESDQRNGWNPAAAVLVFCILQGLIFLVEWFWFFRELTREEFGMR